MKTVIVIRNSYLVVSSEDEELLEAIYETLSFKDSSKAYTYGGRFDPNLIVTVHFAKFVEDLNLSSVKVPIGFLDFIKSVVGNCDLVDQRAVLPEIDLDQIESLDGIELREHQLGAIYKALSKRRGIVKGATGSGKSEVIIAMLNMIETPSLVLFNRQQLTRQTVNRAIKRGVDVGIVQGANMDEKHITMATVQSIHKIENIKKYKNLLLDEVQNVASKQYQKILKMKHWERVYGFSATPVNPKKMDLKSAKIIANVGPVIYDVDSKELIEKGVIAKPKIYMVPINFPEDIDDFDYRTAETVGIIYNKHRNRTIANLAKKHEESGVLILNKFVGQGKEVQKFIPDAPFIWHETPVKERLSIIEKFDAGEIKILIASRILDEGIDIRNFKTLIIASAGISFVKTIQRLGRGLRATENKKEVVVYDFLDNTNYKLLKHSKTRMRTYKMFGYDDIITIEEAESATV